MATEDKKNGIGESILLGLGNPLLDISANCDSKFLEKYNLKANDAILAAPEHMPIYQEMIDKYKVDYIAGGSCQNSIRVAQWIIDQPNACAMMGCVGKDTFAQTLRTKAEESGVNIKYQYNSKNPTGVCAVVITDNGKCRSLVTKLEAANHFTESHFDEPENKQLIAKAKFFYITGFFLTVSPSTILRIGKHACENNKVFVMNLSAEFICDFFINDMMKVFPYVDILFGNETEAAKFSKSQKFETTDIKKIALKASELPKINKNRSRVVIITQGADCVIVAQDGKVTEVPVTKIASDKIVDTNGAGDAFVGGFLSQLIQDKSVNECIKCALWAAREIIQRSSCTFQADLKYKC